MREMWPAGEEPCNGGAEDSLTPCPPATLTGANRSATSSLFMENSQKLEPGESSGAATCSPLLSEERASEIWLALRDDAKKRPLTPEEEDLYESLTRRLARTALALSANDELRRAPNQTENAR